MGEWGKRVKFSAQAKNFESWSPEIKMSSFSDCERILDGQDGGLVIIVF